MDMKVKEMAAAIAGQTEDVRRTMLTDRLTIFYEMPEDERQNAMATMMEAVYSLPDEDTQKIVATRTAILADFPEEKRRALLSTHMQIVQALSEGERNKEIQFVKDAAGGLPEPQKSTMMTALQNMMDGGM